MSGVVVVLLVVAGVIVGVSFAVFVGSILALIAVVHRQEERP